MSDNLQRALKKIKRFSNTRKWCGRLTPSEIIALVDNGAIVENTDQWSLDFAKKQIKKGECSPSWFYFFPGKNWAITKPKKH